MLFHTWVFLVFFLVVYLGLRLLRQTRLWLPWLLVASYVFYGWWNPYYLLLVFYSTLVDYAVVAWMDRCPPAKGWRNWRTLLLIVSLVNNLGLLGFFKYADFFVENLNLLLSSIGASVEFASPESMMPSGWSYLLPVGISFYTFQSLSYTIDFYRGRIRRESSLIRFATFVSFFPQLVAGPIERSSKLLPQLYKPPTLTLTRLTDGLSLFVVGLFKKVALANYLGQYVEPIYAQPENYQAGPLAMATFCFAWQIYFDFSGYTDMARGVAKAMGFELMINFNHPYLATGLGDFWSRWHISLSSWFRDYVYIPLGGSRQSEWKTYRNLLIVFVVSGFWHGAAWTFIVWGALHALGVITTRRLERAAWYTDYVPTTVKRLTVFLFVCFAWIFFRAATIEDAGLIVHRIMTGFAWGNPYCPLWLLLMVFAVWTYQWIWESRYKRVLQYGWVRATLLFLMIAYLSTCSSSGGDFIYFQF